MHPPTGEPQVDLPCTHLEHRPTGPQVALLQLQVLADAVKHLGAAWGRGGRSISNSQVTRFVQGLCKGRLCTGLEGVTAGGERETETGLEGV